MKKTAIRFFAALTLYSCGNQVCTISGTLSEPVDSVRLVDMSGKILDACPLTDGTFLLRCERNPETGVSLILGADKEPVSLVPDVKEIVISMVNGTPVTEGSPLSRNLQDLQKWALETYMGNMMRAMALIEAGNQQGADSLNALNHRIIADHCREVYKKHTKDPVGHQAMTLMMMDLDADEFITLFEQGGRIIREDAQIGGYYEHLKSIPGEDVLTLLEDGTLTSEKGSFEDFVGAGHYTLVDFWASWCGPCKKETPNIVAVFEKYAPKGLVVIGIPVNDKKEASVQAMKELGIHYPQVLDPSQMLAKKFGVRGIPYIILFDPDGNILAQGLRGARIEEAVKKVL